MSETAKPLPRSHLLERKIIGDRKVLLNGKKFRYVNLGESSADTIFFFTHGLGARAGQFRYIIPAVTEPNTRVVSFDAFGHGETNTSQDDESIVGIDRYVDTAVLILNAIFGLKTDPVFVHLKTTSQAPKIVFVGHSMGSYVAIRLAKYSIDNGIPLQGLVQIGFNHSVTYIPPVVRYTPIFVLDLLRAAIGAESRRQCFGIPTLEAAPKYKDREAELAALTDEEFQSATHVVAYEDTALRNNSMWLVRSMGKSFLDTKLWNTAETTTLKTALIDYKRHINPSFRWAVLNGEGDKGFSHKSVTDWLTFDVPSVDFAVAIETQGGHNPHVNYPESITKWVKFAAGEGEEQYGIFSLSDELRPQKVKGCL